MLWFRCSLLFIVLMVHLFRSVHASESTDNIVSHRQDVAEVFIPEKEWKVIKEGQTIPAGLHVRMDFTTGLKEAKLMDAMDRSPEKSTEIQLVSPDVQEDEQIQRRHALLRSEMEKALKNMADSSLADFDSGQETDSYNASEVLTKYRSYAELKKDFAALNGQIKTDQETIKELMAKYRSSREDVKEERSRSNQERLTILQDLEYYVHQVDNALDFFTMNGSEILNDAFEDECADIRTEAAALLGAAVQNNNRVKARILGTKSNLLAVLSKTCQVALGKVSVDATEENFVRKVLFVYSAMMRNSAEAQSWVFRGSSECLSTCLSTRTFPLKIRQKSVTLLNDLMEEWKTESRSFPLSSLLVQEWCHSFLKDLTQKEHGFSKEIFRNIELCSHYFPQLPDYVPDLSSFIDLYKKLAVENDETAVDDFYSSLASTAQNIQSAKKPTRPVMFHADEL